MNDDKPQVLVELDQHDRRRTHGERLLIVAILVIGTLVALGTGYLITDVDEGIRSIKCSDGDVTLLVERADGGVDRVVCPAGASVKP